MKLCRCCSYVPDVMTGVAMYRSRALLQSPASHPTLPDVGFDLIPDFNAICHSSQIESYFLLSVMRTRPLPPHQSDESAFDLTILIVYTLFRMMVFQEGGVNIFCRFAVVDGVLLLLRGTTVAVTSV